MIAFLKALQTFQQRFLSFFSSTSGKGEAPTNNLE
jgi:hypothetical protein